MEKIIKAAEKCKKKIKSWALSLLSFRLVASGFTGEEARQWTRLVYREFKKHRYSLRQIRWAVKRGFLPKHVERFGLNEENYTGTISRKEYAFLRPINGIYSKWLNDIVSVHTIFKPFRSVFPTCYYQIVRRDGSALIIPLHDADSGDDPDDILSLLRKEGRLEVQRASRGKKWQLAYEDGRYYQNGQEMDCDELKQWLCGHKKSVVVMEKVVPSKEFTGSKISLTVFNELGDNPEIGDAYIQFRKVAHQEEDGADGAEDAEMMADVQPEEALLYYIDKKTGNLLLHQSFLGREKVNPSTNAKIPEKVPNWECVLETIDRMCRFAPQLEFLGLKLVITKEGFKVTHVSGHPNYPARIPFGTESTAFLRRKVEQKRSAYTRAVKVKVAAKKIFLIIRAKFSRLFFPKGILPYISTRWLHDLKKDFCTNKDTTLREKLWAAKHGFISYRLHQYGITKENHLNYISDFEYKWLRHINNKYRHWMEDKITAKYICSEYNQFFPEYYYHISLKDGNNRILPMMDCPPGYTNTYADILRLAREKGSLALKPDEGSHGHGFYKLSYSEGKYYLNHVEAREEDVLAILQDVKNRYLITEYINMHPDLKRIYDGAVNTIRMIVFKKDGKTPEIGNAYMRFGSKRTGAVDNMGAGGMYARVDVDTGRFYDAKIIEANEIKPCLYHPDTNEKIEGYLPNWEKVKNDVLTVAQSIPQLEYFGFDLALTEDGLKFPEINRFPDYPAIEKYSSATIDYLLYKLQMKKKRYGYDVSRGHTLVRLPKR